MLRQQLKSVKTLKNISTRPNFQLSFKRLNSSKSGANNTQHKVRHYALGSVAIASLSLLLYSQSSHIFNDSPVKKGRLITVEELEKHKSEDDCWVVIKGKVYDMSEFISKHPGGPKVIVENAGKDVTKIFVPIHPPDAIAANLPADKCLGDIVGEPEIAEELPDDDEEERLENIENKPSLAEIINVYDFEKIAKNVLTKNAWAYYSSAADDEITMRENHFAYQRIYFRPRVLVDVSEIDLSTEMLGSKTSVPFYISATALAKLGHPDGEMGIARAAGKEDVIQMISTLSSCSLEETASVALPDQTQWFQLYVNEDRDKCKQLVKKAEKLGMKGIFVTVDAPSLGNREKDKRTKFKASTDVDLGDNLDRSQGASKALSNFIDTRLTWDDIKTIQQTTTLPIIIKGVQRVEDVLLAAEHGCQGVVLSNHGGRQLDFAPAPVQLLAEVMPILREKKLDDKLDIFVDGGVRRGTDVIKALCLGAKGVGIGRPILYSLSSYGENGVRKAIQILKDELEMDMRLLGARNIGELNESFVDTRYLIGRDAPDMLFSNLYSPLNAVKFRNE